jgi:hypothetical protein
MKKLMLLLSTLVMLCTPAFAATAGHVTVSGSNVQDSTGTLLDSVTISFAPVNNSGAPISYRVDGKGQAISTPVTTLMTNGAFSITLADTSLTAPQNVCYSVTIRNNSNGKQILGPGYNCVQPSASGPAVTSSNAWCTAQGVCDFNKYSPNLAALVIVQTGPAGPPNSLVIGAITPVPNNTSPTATIPGTAPNQTLNLSLETGPPGGGLSYPRVISDASNGLDVTGNVATSNVNAHTVNGVFGISDFGIKCDGATDDSVGLNSIGTFAATQTSGNAVTVSFPSNADCVHASPITTWIVSNLHLHGNGSRLKYTPGTTGAILTARISNAGAYSVCPTGVTFTGSGGSGATATVSCIGTSPNLTVSSIILTAKGSGYPVRATTIAFTGGTSTMAATATAIITPQILLHGPGSAVTEFDNIWIEGFVLQGNPNATDGLYQDNSVVARGHIDIINAQDYTDACFYLPNVELSEYLVLNCSARKAVVMGTPQVTTPNYGLIAGDPDMLGGTGFFANNRVVTVSLEGTQLIGLWCKICSNQNHFFGTSEGTTSSSGTVGVGLVDGAAGNGQGNTFSMDFEGNALADTQISGFGETFLSTVSLGNFTVLSGGFVDIFGGEYQQITLNSGHSQATIEGIFYNSEQTSGTITGNTTADCIINAENRVGGAVTNDCLGGLYFPLSGGTITGNIKIDGSTQIIGNLQVGGILSTGGAATAYASNGDIVVENANAIRASSALNNASFPLIRGNSNNNVWIDPNGQGIVAGSDSNPIPFTSTTTPTAGSGVCWKTPTTLGTCTAGTWPHCTTCN